MALWMSGRRVMLFNSMTLMRVMISAEKKQLRGVSDASPVILFGLCDELGALLLWRPSVGCRGCSHGAQICVFRRVWLV